MVRQCAWCLRLIDSAGERISQAPLPKLYEASHGICGVCGTLWMEQVLGTQGTQELSLQNQEASGAETLSQAVRRSPQETITQLILQLQQQRTSPPRNDPPSKNPSPQRKGNLRIIT